jgi:hypothetical protein
MTNLGVEYKWQVLAIIRIAAMPPEEKRVKNGREL